MATRNRLLFVSVEAVLVIGLLLTTNHEIVRAEAGCNGTPIAGTYGFAINGLLSPSFKGQPQQIGAFIPLAAVGTFTFDGDGQAARSFILSVGGQIGPAHDSGPYRVNANCKGSATSRTALGT